MYERKTSMQQYVSSITQKGQVTIPADVRRLLGVAPHDKVAFVVEADHVRLAPAQSVVARTAGLFKSAQSRLTPQEEHAAAEQAMAEEATAEGAAGG